MAREKQNSNIKLKFISDKQFEFNRVYKNVKKDKIYTKLPLLKVLKFFHIFDREVPQRIIIWCQGQTRIDSNRYMYQCIN